MTIAGSDQANAVATRSFAAQSAVSGMSIGDYLIKRLQDYGVRAAGRLCPLVLHSTREEPD